MRSDEATSHMATPPRQSGRVAPTLGGLLFLALFAGLVVAGYHVDHPYRNTKVAPGFSLAGFRSLQPGATRGEVRRIAGNPMSVGSNDREEEWFYAGGAMDHRTGHCVFIRCFFDPKSGALLRKEETEWWDTMD